MSNPQVNIPQTPTTLTWLITMKVAVYFVKLQLQLLRLFLVNLVSKSLRLVFRINCGNYAKVYT